MALKLLPGGGRKFVAPFRLQVRAEVRQAVGGGIARQGKEIPGVEVEGAGNPLKLLGVGAPELTALQAHDRGAGCTRRIAQGFEGQALARPLAGDELAKGLEIAGHGDIVSLSLRMRNKPSIEHIRQVLGSRKEAGGPNKVCDDVRAARMMVTPKAP